MPPLEVWEPDLDDWDPSLRVPPRPLRGRLLAASCAAALTAAGWMVWDQLVLPPPLLLEGSQAFAPRREPDANPAARHLLPAISISEAANFSGDARPLPPPAPGSWLYEHPERGQTFHQFVLHAHNRPSPARNTLYLLPLGDLDSDERAVLSVTRDFIGVYFNTPTDVLPPRPIPTAALDPRRQQLNARDLLEHLSDDLPDDALGVLAVTDRDLFIPGIDFVFGLGSADLRVAAFSLARYGRDFELDGRPQTVLRRALTVAVHELGHVLNMRHCTEFRCLMNGTSSLREADQHTLHLCPVCIRKASLVMGFDRYERYERLHEFYTTWSFNEEAAFVERRLDAPAP
jgi:archaemetzincin